MQVEHLLLNSTDGQWTPGTVARGDAQWVLYFGATDLIADGQVYRQLRERFPAALIAGASAGSQIRPQSVDDDAVVAIAVSFAQTRVRGAIEPIVAAEESFACGARLGQQLADPELAGVFVLSDGLAVNGTGLADGLTSTLAPGVAISGGLAGDGARFSRTLVGLDRPPAAGQVAAVGLYGPALRISHAAAGGWDAFGPPRRITRAVGNTLHELDDKPALDLYQRYLGEEAEGLPGTALLYPLKIWHPDRPEQALVRTVLSIDRDARTMTFAGDLPQNWHAQLMRGTHDRLISGAADAAARARSGLPADAGPNRLALLVSCVGRRLLMGQRTGDEVDAVCAVLGPGTDCSGFYSYGEMAPSEAAGRCDLHNQTMTVTMIAEA